MADDLTKRGKPDRDRVNPSEKWEVDPVAKKFSVTPAAVKEAIKKVGPMREDVERELAKKKK